jgi:hypothetical protein
MIDNKEYNIEKLGNILNETNTLLGKLSSQSHSSEANNEEKK